jgi:hypothetical protein
LKFDPIASSGRYGTMAEWRKRRKSSIKTLRPAFRLASHPNSEERGGIKS